MTTVIHMGNSYIKRICANCGKNYSFGIAPEQTAEYIAWAKTQPCDYCKHVPDLPSVPAPPDNLDEHGRRFLAAWTERIKQGNYEDYET